MSVGLGVCCFWSSNEGRKLRLAWPVRLGKRVTKGGWGGGVKWELGFAFFFNWEIGIVCLGTGMPEGGIAK